MWHANANANANKLTTTFPTDRNTTLPHPSADTSPNATIIAPDIVARRHSRSRSFLRSHSHSHKQTKSQDIPNGTITTLAVDPSKMYEGIEYADGSKEGVSPTGSKEAGSPDGNVVVGSGGSEMERDETGYAPGGRKKGILRKKVLHKV